MNDADLRALVRDAVARHLGGGVGAAAPTSTPMPIPHQSAPFAGPHPSHVIYISLVNDTDACVIEPGVPCSHCNYCRSHGH